MQDILLKLITNSTFLTVISGVLVYVVSQYFLEFVINPLKEYRVLKQRIMYLITMYSCYYTNPYNLLDTQRNIRDKREYDEASVLFRKMGSDLAGYVGMLPWYMWIKKKRLTNVLHELIGISNGFYIVTNEYSPIRDNRDCERKIKELLKIK